MTPGIDADHLSNWATRGSCGKNKNAKPASQLDARKKTSLWLLSVSMGWACHRRTHRAAENRLSAGEYDSVEPRHLDQTCGPDLLGYR